MPVDVIRIYGHCLTATWMQAESLSVGNKTTLILLMEVLSMRTYRLRATAPVIFAVALASCSGHSGTNAVMPNEGTQSQSVSSPLSISRAAHRMHDLTLSAGGLTASHAAGAGYPVTATPPVSHPAEAPCVDTLFTPTTPPIPPETLPVGTFGDYADHLFNYTPPNNCPGPYAKVVLKVKFNVSAGVQYDRTGAIWVGATNIFFGSTAEPGSSASPTWTVERDVTEYAPIFAAASTGQASVYNIVNSQYTGTIYGTAELDFYPATQQFPAGKSADAVYPLSAGATGGYTYLDTPSSQMAGTFTFPQNVDQAYLDVFLESQSSDEFWYTCVPNDIAQKLNNCGNTAFREGTITIDGQPAGVAPVFPWIYTGGLDPYLWIPMPGVETLNFKPYRVNLTPFAAQLDDGKPHTIAVTAYNANNYFSANAALLVYEDHGSTQVTGALVRNGTSAAPSETVVEKVNFDPSGNANGTVNTTSAHPVSLDGYVNTSNGRIETRVTQNVRFSNFQNIVSTSTEFLQNINQQTTVTSDTTTIAKGNVVNAHYQSIWPFKVNYLYKVNADGTATQTVGISQTKNDAGLASNGDVSSSLLQNTAQSSDTLTFTSSGFSPSNGKSTQEYKSVNGNGNCYDKLLQSLNYVLTSSTLRC